jgi:hypothetical protein
MKDILKGFRSRRTMVIAITLCKRLSLCQYMLERLGKAGLEFARSVLETISVLVMKEGLRYWS